MGGLPLDFHAQKIIRPEKDFLTAFRDYSDSFIMPGEAQKIDRIMETFGKKYSSRSNLTPDQAYLAAICTVVLSTSLHKPAVKSPSARTSRSLMNKGF